MCFFHEGGWLCLSRLFSQEATSIDGSENNSFPDVKLSAGTDAAGGSSLSARPSGKRNTFSSQL